MEKSKESEKKETNTVSVNAWQQPTAGKYLQSDVLKVERRFLFPPSLVTKNDNKFYIYTGVILYRIAPFFLYLRNFRNYLYAKTI